MDQEGSAAIDVGAEMNDQKPQAIPAISDPGVPWDLAPLTRQVFWEHWRTARTDRNMKRLLAQTCLYSVWDAGEVLPDFGGAWSYWNEATRARSGYPEVVSEGLDAYLEYAPVMRMPGEYDRIYRSFRRGEDLELFLADTRSFRSRDDQPDASGKTMLGLPQLDWLRKGLVDSKATWKVVCMSAPLSIPIGDPHARDGWAAAEEQGERGFESELLDLLDWLDRGHVRNVVFLTAGADWPAEMRYARDFDGDGVPLVFYEVSVGPLYGRTGNPAPLDPTLAPQLLYSEGGVTNFGFGRVQRDSKGNVHFLADVRGEDGRTRPGSGLDLIAQ